MLQPMDREFMRICENLPFINHSPENQIKVHLENRINVETPIIATLQFLVLSMHT